MADIQTLAEGKHSVARIQNKKDFYSVGDQIKVDIVLFDSHLRRINDDRDTLRIWMIDRILNASVGGYVESYGNGTYLGVVEALWVGNPEIKVAIGCNKEHVGIFLNYVKVHGTFHFVKGIFQKENVKGTATTQCTSIPNSPLYQGAEVCNYTEDNSNLPFYCAKPKNYDCKNWEIFRNQGEEPFLDKATSRFFR